MTLKLYNCPNQSSPFQHLRQSCFIGLKVLNSSVCVCQVTHDVFVGCASADRDNKENLIQWGSTLSPENSSHIVKTAIRSCRCGAAAGSGAVRAAMNHARRRRRRKRTCRSPPAHLGCRCQMDAERGWLQKPLFISTYCLFQQEQREEGRV